MGSLQGLIGNMVYCLNVTSSLSISLVRWSVGTLNGGLSVEEVLDCGLRG